MDYIICMPYIGGVLSKNNSKWPGGRGFKPQVKKWMGELEEIVKDCSIPKTSKYIIKLKGFFQDDRRPDLANLHEVIGDSVKRGLGVDDKHYMIEDEGWDYWSEPYLRIIIVPEGDL